MVLLALKETPEWVGRQCRDKKLVVPAEDWFTALKYSHNDIGHEGTKRVISLARDTFYWPYIKKEIQSTCWTEETGVSGSRLTDNCRKVIYVLFHSLLTTWLQNIPKITNLSVWMNTRMIWYVLSLESFSSFASRMLACNLKSHTDPPDPSYP